MEMWLESQVNVHTGINFLTRIVKDGKKAFFSKASAGEITQESGKFSDHREIRSGFSSQCCRDHQL